MALVETIIEIRPYIGTWLALVNILDDIRGLVYHYLWCFDHEVDEADADLVSEISKAKVGIQLELEYEANDMNLPQDEERALKYLQDIKRSIITEIRDNPTVTLIQAQDFIATQYINSIIDFTELYKWYLNLLGLTTWDEFKSHVINNKFKGSD
jgi:hypothetical protein